MLNRANIQIVGLSGGGTTGTTLQTCLAEIGDWNMDTTAINPNVGLYWSNIGICGYKVVDVQATIRADANVVGIPTYPLSLYTSAGVTSAAGSVSWTTTGLTSGVVLQRTTGGHFDCSDFNDTSYNRGWLTIRYSDAITPPAPVSNEVDFNVTSYNAGDNNYYSCRKTELDTSLEMSAGQCYCLCLTSNLCVDAARAATASYALLCITCNLTECYCTCIDGSINCVSPIHVSFQVCSGDTVCIYQEACATTGVALGGVRSQTCIPSISGIVGNFCKGDICTDICTYSITT